jgi:flagellar biogenesis protein FliO
MSAGESGTPIAPAIQFLQVVAALGIVLLVAWLVLRFGLSRLKTFRTPASGIIEVIARYPLESRKTLYLVRAGSSTMLIASSESQVHYLSQVDAATAQPVTDTAQNALPLHSEPRRQGNAMRFTSLLAQNRGKEVRP